MGGEANPPDGVPGRLEVSTSDTDKLFGLVKQAREFLRGLRLEAGLHPHAAGPHIDPEGHHASDSPAQRERERGEREGHEDGRAERGHEGRGEHEGRGHEGRERGEHGGSPGGEEGAGRHESQAKLQRLDKVYPNGARLTLQYNSSTEAFVGAVQNTTPATLPDVRVEIHLSSGVELGPTKRVDLEPGVKLAVELGAFGEEFTSWVTHPESGNEHEGGEGNSAEHEARERGEHGGRGEQGGKSREDSQKPTGAELHPVYNQIRLLQGELKAFQADLAAVNNPKDV